VLIPTCAGRWLSGRGRPTRVVPNFWPPDPVWRDLSPSQIAETNDSGRGLPGSRRLNTRRSHVRILPPAVRQSQAQAGLFFSEDGLDGRRLPKVCPPTACPALPSLESGSYTTRPEAAVQQGLG
jgi:hypothetical protein